MPTTQDLEHSIKLMISHIGDSPAREGLIHTPSRVIRSWNHLYKGYFEKEEDILSTVFIEGACNEMVVLKHIDFYSTCEHHLMPFFGKAAIGYIPDGKVVGISKLARLVEMYSRRLQIQEKMTGQIADALEKHLSPQGCMVVVEAQHLCMIARGVEKPNSVMRTSAIRGCFEDIKVREEFLRGL